MGTDALPPTEGMCACGAALPTFVLMHGGKRCDKCRNAPDATGAMDTIIQKLRRSTQPGLAPLYGFTPAEAELMLARLAPEPAPATTDRVAPSFDAWWNDDAYGCLRYSDPVQFDRLRQAFNAGVAAARAAPEPGGSDDMRRALEQIKGMVCGDAKPRWDNSMETTGSRGLIADICDLALRTSK